MLSKPTDPITVAVGRGSVFLERRLGAQLTTRSLCGSLAARILIDEAVLLMIE